MKIAKQIERLAELNLDLDIGDITQQKWDSEVRKIISKNELTLELLKALKLAVHALNRVPNFKVNCIDTSIKDSYQIASICDKAIAKAEASK